MRRTASKPLLRVLRESNQQWFAKGNKQFFGDRQYWGYYGGASGNPYLLRSTYAWTDMFDQPRRLHYRINKVEPNTYEILDLIDDEFNTIELAKMWVKLN